MVTGDKKRGTPEFGSIDEMAEFFDHANSQDLDWEDTNLKFERPKMVHISIRIPEEDLKMIRKQARKLGIGYTAMIRMVLHRALSKIE